MASALIAGFGATTSGATRSRGRLAVGVPLRGVPGAGEATGVTPGLAPKMPNAPIGVSGVASGVASPVCMG